jgi:hypothetical protein
VAPVHVLGHDERDLLGLGAVERARDVFGLIPLAYVFQSTVSVPAVENQPLVSTVILWRKP